MPVSPYMLNQALSSLAVTTLAALWQNPTRAAAALTGVTNGEYTVTTPPFKIVTGLAVTIASANLPSQLAGLSVLYIRPVPASTNKFYVYSSLANAETDTSRLVPTTSFTGTVLDLALEQQPTLNTLLVGSELAFTGYARATVNYAAGALPTTALLARSSSFPLVNNGAETIQVSHVLAFVSTNLIGLAKLASPGSVAPGATLALTTIFSAQSV